MSTQSSIAPTLSLRIQGGHRTLPWGNVELDEYSFSHYQAAGVKKIVDKFADVDLKLSPLFFADIIWSYKSECVIEKYTSIIVSRWEYQNEFYVKLADGNIVNISEFAKSYAL